MTKPNADKIAVNSAVFSGNLTAAETDVQKALEKIDSMSISAQGFIQTAEADSNISAGQPVYLKGNGHIEKARANVAGTSGVVGLAAESISSGTSGDFQKDGTLELADWTAVIGSADLTIGATYFLSPSTAGLLTSIAPTATGEYVCSVGQAITTKILAIEIQPKILL